METLAAELVRDIETFDLDLAGKERPRRRPAAQTGRPPWRPTSSIRTSLPEMPSAQRRALSPGASHQAGLNSGVVTGSRFLDDLRQRARSASARCIGDGFNATRPNEAMDRSLRQVFLYLHELVQQLQHPCGRSSPAA